MVNANHFPGQTDNEVIENAMSHLEEDRILLIPPRKSNIEPERDWWLLDRAILIPANTTVILQNCRIKLSDACRDNFFRTANCGMGIADPERIQNVHLRGEGHCVLEGADRPRATGDSSKTLHCPCPHREADLLRLADWIPDERRKAGKVDFWDIHNHSYGTDAGKEGESQYGDWRGIGVLFANVEHFSIENLHIVDSHGWGISLEACAYGRVEKIHFDARMSKEIDGLLQNMENQDGVDLRNGCHHITISDITGQTGDDVVALTAIVPDEYTPHPGGIPCSTHVMHGDWSRRERDIHDILIRNVIATSYLCFLVRLLPCNTRIWNVVIDGVVDTSEGGVRPHGGVILLGEGDSAYGRNLPDGLTNITISNVICNSGQAILVPGYLKDSVITNVINRNPNCPVINVVREGGLQNVLTSNLCTVQ